MNENVFQRVALRYRAIFLPIEKARETYEPTPEVMAFVAQLREKGFMVSEELLHALSEVPVSTLEEITALIDKVMRVKLNWMPLVKGWDVPTGETRQDHLITFIANLFGGEAAELQGTTLACGHFIPEAPSRWSVTTVVLTAARRSIPPTSCIMAKEAS